MPDPNPMTMTAFCGPLHRSETVHRARKPHAAAYRPARRAGVQRARDPAPPPPLRASNGAARPAPPCADFRQLLVERAPSAGAPPPSSARPAPRPSSPVPPRPFSVAPALPLKTARVSKPAIQSPDAHWSTSVQTLPMLFIRCLDLDERLCWSFTKTLHLNPGGRGTAATARGKPF